MRRNQSLSGVAGAAMIERLAAVETRLSGVEKDLVDLNELWRTTADDIKMHIKAALADIKSEQLAELKAESKEMRLRQDKLELRQASWDTSVTMANWIIRVAFLAIGAVGSFLGLKHFG